MIGTTPKRYGPCTCSPPTFEHVARELISCWLNEMAEDGDALSEIDIADIAGLAGDLAVQAGRGPFEVHELLSVHARGETPR